MCKGRVCFNLLITPVYLEIVFAIDSVCDVYFICLLSMIPRHLKSFTVFISSSINVIFGYRTCVCGIWHIVILVFDVFISRPLGDYYMYMYYKSKHLLKLAVTNSTSHCKM